MNSILKKISYTYLINFLDIFFAFFSIYLLTNNLSIQTYGDYNYLISIIGFTITFISFGLSLYNYKEITGKDNDLQYSIFKSSISIQLLIFFFSIVILYSFLLTEYDFTIQIIIYVLIFFTFLNNEFAKFIGLKLKIVEKNILTFIELRFWLIIFFLIKKDSLLQIFYSKNLISIIVFLVYIIFFIDIKKIFKSKSNNIKKAFTSGLIFILMDLGYYILELGDRVVIKAMLDSYYLGQYSFAYNWIRLIGKFSLLIIYIVQPYFKIFHDNKDSFRNIINIVYKIAILFSICCSIYLNFNYEIITNLVSKAEYIKSKEIYMILSLFPIFLVTATILQLLLILENEKNKVAIAYLIVSILNILLNILFIKMFGIIGPAIITSFSYMILALYFYMLHKKYIKIFSLGKLLTTLLKILLLAIIFYLISYIHSFILNILISFIVGIGYLLVSNIIKISEVEMLFITINREGK